MTSPIRESKESPPTLLSQPKLSTMAKYWRGRNQEDQEEEEEALSLSDLPINLAKTEEAPLIRSRESDDEGEEAEEEASSNKTGEKEEPEFDFGWWGNNGQCGASESHMCVADEVFFKGQILPLRLSISSDNGLVCRSMSRSESMDHASVSRFIGSRSSSIGSYHSNTSSSSTNSSSVATKLDHHKPPLRNHQFNTHSGTKPLPVNASIRYRQSSLRSTQNNSRFSLWDFFRTGLVRGPAADIELRDLKSRSFISSNKKISGISRNSSNSSSNDSAENNFKSNKKRTRQGLIFDTSNIGRLFGGVNCKCSVETVPLNAPTARMDLAVTDQRRRTRGSDRKPRKDSNSNTKTSPKTKQKQAVSRQRTSEWLKELSLSHAS